MLDESGMVLGTQRSRTSQDADPCGEEKAGGGVGGVAQLPQHRAPQQHHKLRRPAAHSKLAHTQKMTLC